jgi:O-antigen ligase
MSRGAGWRSARWRAPTGLAELAPAGVATGGLTSVVPPAAATPSGWFTWPWKGVSWNISYICSLVFCWVIITYEAKIGSVAIVLGVIGLAFVRESLRIPGPLLWFGAFNLICVAGFASSQFPDIVKDGMMSLWKLWLIGLVFFNAVRSREQARFFLFFYLACFALYPVRGALFNFFLYHASLRGGRIAWNNVFGNPNDLAALLFFPLGLAAGFLFTERKKYVRWAAMAGIVIVPFVIFLTQSRAGLIALAFFGMFAFFGHAKHFRALVGIAAVLGAAALFAPDSVWSRIGTIEKAADVTSLGQVDDEGSAEQRFEIWRIAIAITKDNAVAGVGIGAYPYVHQLYARQGAFKQTARGQRDTHSTYFNLLAETGVSGFLLFLGVLLSCVLHAERTRRLLKRNHDEGARQIYFMEVALVAFLITAVFGSYGSLSFTYIHLFALWIFADAYRRSYRAATPMRSAMTPMVTAHVAQGRAAAG